MKLPAGHRLVATLALLLGAAPPPAPATRPTLYLVGDSTMADKADPANNPEHGWGQELPRFVGTTRLVVRNHAANGRSTRRFLDEGRWDSVMARVRPGDYVLVQFAHNDGHLADPARCVNAYTGFRRNLERMVADTRARGATPIVASPVVRRYFNEYGVLTDAHGAYGYVLRRVAREQHVAFVDLQLMTENLVAGLGPERPPSARRRSTCGWPRGSTRTSRRPGRTTRTSPRPARRRQRGGSRRAGCRSRAGCGRATIADRKRDGAPARRGTRPYRAADAAAWRTSSATGPR